MRRKPRPRRGALDLSDWPRLGEAGVVSRDRFRGPLVANVAPARPTKLDSVYGICTRIGEHSVPGAAEKVKLSD
jgi:hypothetical protein